MGNEVQTIAPGVARLGIVFVNAFGIREADGSWVLVDTGLPASAARTQAAFEEHFGGPPKAIVLTHGHFDHVGGAHYLATAWNVPIHAHRLEMPYLTGRSDYPPPDPTIGGPLAQMGRFSKAKGTNISEFVHPLEGDESGAVPGLNDWQWIFTPGHSPGHVVLWRERDRVLLAGDAVATMNMDSYAEMFAQTPRLARSGAPFICDWPSARASTQTVADLKPQVLACGHGQPITGENVADDLADFAVNFPMPAKGRYVDTPAITDENGIMSLPPAAPDPVPKIAAGVALGVLALRLMRRRV